jgi:hypothetical protein
VTDTLTWVLIVGGFTGVGAASRRPRTPLVVGLRTGLRGLVDLHDLTDLRLGGGGHRVSLAARVLHRIRERLVEALVLIRQRERDAAGRVRAGPTAVSIALPTRPMSWTVTSIVFSA